MQRYFENLLSSFFFFLYTINIFLFVLLHFFRPFRLSLLVLGNFTSLDKLISFFQLPVFLPSSTCSFSFLIHSSPRSLGTRRVNLKLSEELALFKRGGTMAQEGAKEKSSLPHRQKFNSTPLTRLTCKHTLWLLTVFLSLIFPTTQQPPPSGMCVL